MPPDDFKEAQRNLTRAVEKRRLASIPDQEHVVPARTHSLLAPTRRQASRNLSEISQRLRYRDSNVSIRSASSNSTAGTTGSSKSLEFLHGRQELLTALNKEWLNVEEGLIEALQALTIDEKTFKEELSRVKKHRFRIISEQIQLSRNVTQMEGRLEGRNEPDWPAAYMELLVKTFKDDLQHKCHPIDQRDSKEHVPWKHAVRLYYNSLNHENKELVWCAILQKYYHSITMKTAHIVPHSIGYENVGHIFGDKTRGYNDMWAVGNGLPMLSNLETTFDMGMWTLVGERRQGQPTEYRFTIVDQSLFEIKGVAGIDYRTLAGRKLEFRSANRPDPKFVYFHFATSLMRHHKMQTPGIEERMITLLDGVAWGKTGDWYDTSTLKYMGMYWGACVKRAFPQAVTQEPDSENEEASVAAAEIFVGLSPAGCEEMREESLDESLGGFIEEIEDQL